MRVVERMDEGCISILCMCVDHIRRINIWNLLLEQLNLRWHVVYIDNIVSFRCAAIFLTIRSDPNNVVVSVSALSAGRFHYLKHNVRVVGEN